MSVKIRQMICPKDKWWIKCPNYMTPECLVVHNTANDASANNEIAYMNRNDSYTSYHFAVDDIEVVQGLPLNRNGWHAGDGANGWGNRKGIGIEICYSKSGGGKFDKAEKNAAWLIAKLLKERGWGLDRVKKHQDFMPSKRCPHRTLDYGWDRFLKMVAGELNKLKTPPKPKQADIIYTSFPKKTVRLVRDTNLCDFSATELKGLKAIKGYVVGELIDVVAEANNKTLGKKFYMTDYSWNNGKIRATNGFKLEDCEDLKPEIASNPPKAPQDEPKGESGVLEPKEENKPPVEPKKPQVFPESPKNPEKKVWGNENAPVEKRDNSFTLNKTKTHERERSKTGGGWLSFIINLIKQIIKVLTTKKEK